MKIKVSIGLATELLFFLILFFCLIIPVTSFAQSARFRFYGTKEGFYPDKVKQIVQDKDGFLWFATNEGLIKYDGTFQSIQKEISTEYLSGTDILCLLPESNGNIWIGTNKGLSIYDRERNQFLKVRFPNNEDSYVISLAQDSKGQIWAGTGQGVFKISSQLIAIPLFKHNKFFNTLPFIKSRPSGSLVFITHNMIYTFDPNKALFVDSIFYSNEKVITDNYHTAITMDVFGNLWIGKYNGELYHYDFTTKSITKHDLKLIANNKSAIINNLYANTKDKLWVLVDESGVYYYDYASKKFIGHYIPTKTLLPSYKVNSIFIDREGSTWLTMDRNGIAQLNNNYSTFKQIVPPKEAVNKIVSAVLKDKQGNLWVGTDGSGLFVYNSDNKLIKSFLSKEGVPNGLANDAILCIYQDTKNRVWIGTFRGGLSLFIPSTNSFKHYQYNPNKPNGLLRNDVRSIAEDNEGNLWLGVHGIGVSKFDPNTEQFINYTNLKSPWTNNVIVSKNGTVWASTNGGLSYLPKNDYKFSNILTENLATMEDHDINCVYEDQKGIIWAGTLNGLYYLKQNKLLKAEHSDQLAKINIKSIEEDIQGTLYLGTNRGLCKYVKGQGEQGWYGFSDGMPGEDFVLNSSYNYKGLVYFGTSKGLCWFNPEHLTTEPITACPVVTDIHLFNKGFLKNQNILNAKEITLSHFENFLTLFIASSTFKLSDEKIQIEYKLERLEKEWKTLGKNRSINYYSIPPGQYTFLARNVLAGTTNKGPIYSLKITINPPFWDTWWFRLGVIISGILAAYAYFKFKTWRIKFRNKILEEKIKLRTQEIVDQNEKLERQHQELLVANNTKDTLFSIIAHDLRAPFSSIASLAQLLVSPQSKSDADEQREMTSYILQASRNALNIVENLLDWARTQTGRLHFRPIELSLNQLIIHVIQQYEYQLKDKNITVTFIANNALNVVVDKDMLETILKNLLVNAIKFTQAGGTIDVKVTNDTINYNIVIEDSGVGMSAEQIKRINENAFHRSELGTKGEKGTGLGLEVIKEFLKYHQATWTVTSTVGKGTKFELHFTGEFSVILNSSEKVVFNHLAVNNVIESKVLSESAVDVQFEGIYGKLVLVVDDQEEIRKSIVYSLKENFEILEAENGRVAFDLAKSRMPDLIISDVVMPDMDGLLLSEMLKSEISTSHIPIIILTSQKEEASILLGLKKGIDDYMLKPFNPNILVLKVGNLLQNREQLKKRVSIDEEYLLKPISENSLDKIWLAKTHTIIEQNLSNEDFNVEILSKEMSMHRSNFSKKLTALTGQSPTDLIRIQRMKRAAKLILASGKNISEIAFEVGFSDPKYFSKAFKSHFGMLPSEYQLSQNIK